MTILVQYGKEPDAATRAKWSKKRSAASASAVAAPTEDNGEGNKMAERVLLRVGQKLNGMEEGQVGYHRWKLFHQKLSTRIMFQFQVMSIAGQVNALIQQARDPSNLAAVFVGWQPYI